MHGVEKAETRRIGTVQYRQESVARRCQDFLVRTFASLPWTIVVNDWTGRRYDVGGTEPHWYGAPLELRIGTPEAAKDILSFNMLRFLERFLEGEVGMVGNLFLLALASKHADIKLKPLQVLFQLARHSAFQNIGRASVNVKSHYDIPQSVLDLYLDVRYKSYACGLWEEPERIDRVELVRAGEGQGDEFDSLEKAQWRKFRDAADFLAPAPGETMLDIGCGYGGQLQVALESQPFGKAVGWTHSRNQTVDGTQMLLAAGYDRSRWELNEGDYRQETRVFDHVASTGMFCHVGPRGLVPYVRNVRQRIKKGGRYLHHGMMTPYSRLPLDSGVGIAFQKRYVWPGFHFFTQGDHMRALERNGFRILKAIDYTPHYAKTTAAWYERIMANQEVIRQQLGEATLRAWQVCYAGLSGSYTTKSVYLCRFYCEAI